MIFHTNENTRQSHISCQRWWLWTTVTGDGVTQLQSGQGRRFAGVHGSTPYHRLATSAVSVALAKAAQAGFPRRGLSGPRKPGSSFGRWSPLVGLGHKSRRTHSLKGIVPEVAAHVSVLLGLHIISDGLTSFQTDSNTHQQVSGQGSCCPCCAIGPLTSSPAASRASSSLVS